MKQMFDWKTKNQRKWRAIRWMALIGLLTLLLLGCGGSGDGGSHGGGETIDNSHLYGNYKIGLSTNLCDVEGDVLYLDLEVGNDAERMDEDGYLYIPQTSNSTSSTEQDSAEGTTETTTVTVDGNTVTLLRRVVVDADGSLADEDHVVFTFNDTYTMAEISGHLYKYYSDIDEGDCVGKIWNGAGWRVSDAAPEVTNAFLQTRNPGGVRGWLDFDKGGSMINGDEIDTIRLLNASDTAQEISPSGPYRDVVYQGTWNGTTGQAEFPGPLFYGGMFVTYDGAAPLAPGDYTYEVLLQDATLLTYTLNFPEALLLPVVDEESMQVQWLADGSLQLDWQSPESDDYSRVQVEIYDVDGYSYAGGPYSNEEMVFSAQLPKSHRQLIIPAATIEEINSAKVPKLLRWRMRTLAFNDDTPPNQYARGYSSAIGIEFDPGVTDTASGTWSLDGTTLTLSYTASTFTDCGPVVSPGETVVETFSVDTGESPMIISNEDIDLYWWRFAGDTTEAPFTGKWYGYSGEFNWTLGNTYVLDIVETETDSGTFTLKGLISVCVEEPEEST